MNRISVLAIDDEAPALRRLVSMIEQHPNLVLTGTARNSADAREKILQLQPELLLLDIELKDATAFELLNDLKNHYKGKIIFCTAFDKYALKAFEFEAVDYLLKPYSEERFNASIQRIIAKNEQTDLNRLIDLFRKAESGSKMLAIPEGNKNHFLDAEKLNYIIAEGYYSSFILNEGKKLIRISLKKLEELLPENFIRINKSVIINKNFMKELTLHKTTSKILMNDKSEFFVSEKLINEVQERIL